MSKTFTLAVALSVPLLLAACTATVSNQEDAMNTSSSMSDIIDTSAITATGSVETGTGAMMDDRINESGSIMSEDNSQVYVDPTENARD